MSKLICDMSDDVLVDMWHVWWWVSWYVTCLMMY